MDPQEAKLKVKGTSIKIFRRNNKSMKNNRSLSGIKMFNKIILILFI